MKRDNKMEVDFTDQIIRAKEGKTLNKPFRTPKGPKKFSVYVKNEKGNVVKVNFGDPNMEIKRDDPARRKSFRARHNCDNPGPKTKARYWSCRQWRGGKKVEGELIEAMKPSFDIKVSEEPQEWDGETFVEERDLLLTWPALAEAEEIFECDDWDCEECEAKRGLWDNIRRKKKRMGDKYRPAKPGDKDRPDEKSWKKAQKPKKKSKAAEPKPNGDETHSEYMNRCVKAGYTKEECMKAHEGHSFKNEAGWKKKKY